MGLECIMLSEISEIEKDKYLKLSLKCGICIQMDISSFSPLPFAALLFSAICKASSDNHFACWHYFFLWMVLITASCIMSQISVHSPLGTLSIRSNSISHFHCIIIRDMIKVIPEWSSGFPYFIQFKSEFGNKELLMWATVSSWSCFCWLMNFSIFGYKKYNQSDFHIDHLVMSMCTVFSCVVGRSCLLWPVRSLGKTVSLCPASFCTPNPNLPLTPVSLDFLLLHSSPL